MSDQSATSGAKGSQQNKSTKSKEIYAAILSTGGLVIFLGLVVIAYANLFSMTPAVLWAGIIISIVVLLVGLGLGANGKWYGVLIDTRNRVSLSRMQITLWTILALSAYLAIALPRSRPNALAKPDDQAIAQCQLEKVKEAAGDLNLETWKTDKPEEYAAAQAKAEDECTAQPLQVSFPPELLMALGISTVSFAGSSLVQSMKRNRKDLSLITDMSRKVADLDKAVASKQAELKDLNAEQGSQKNIITQAKEKLKTATPGSTDQLKFETVISGAEGMLELGAERITAVTTELQELNKQLEQAKCDLESENSKREGLLKVNSSAQDARLNDLFQGDELGNYNLLDISKIQMFFFTIALLLAYGSSLYTLLQNQATLFNPLGVALPPFSSSLNTLLAISHAGYLSYKTIDHTKVEST